MRFHFALALCLGLGLTSSTYAGLTGYWTFDGDSVTDLSGGHHGTLVGGAYSTDVPAALAGGKSLDVTAANSYAVIDQGSENDFDLARNITVSAWVKGWPGTWNPFVAKNGEANGWQVRRHGGNNTLDWTTRGAGAGNGDLEGSSTAVSDGQWHHVAVTYDGGNKLIYVDGAFDRWEPAAAAISGSNERLVFGAREREPGGNFESFAQVKLDDIAIYSHALAPGQVAALASGQTPTSLPTPTPAVRYQLNNGTGSTAADSGTHPAGPFPGTLVNFLTDDSQWSTQGLTFDGADDHVNLTNAGTLGFRGNFTASAWIKPDATNGDRTIFGTDQTGDYVGLHLVIRNGKAHMGFYGHDTTGNRTVNTGQWQHVVFRYDNGQHSVFVNGQLDATSSQGFFNGNDVVKLGRWAGGNYFDGMMSNVAIYNQGLSDAEILAMYGSPYSEDFEGTGGQLNMDNWYVSGGMNSTRLRTIHTPDNAYCLGSYDNDPNNPAGTVRNVNNIANGDYLSSMAWGPAFQVNDPTASLYFKVTGQNAAFNETSRNQGGAGVALWDLEANDFVRDGGVVRFASADAQNGTLVPKGLSLAGLQGRTLMPVAIDRDERGWGWVAVDSISAHPDAVTPLNLAEHHRVLADYGFDQAGDWMGWTGDFTSFSLGNMGTGTQPENYIDLTGSFNNAKGFLSSGGLGHHEDAVGVLRSPTFTIAGDLLEFYISGGSDSRLAFELVRASDDSVLRTATGINQNRFHYDFWSISDLVGTQGYLRLRDSHNGSSWGHLEIDAIRMLDLAPVPEPATWTLLGLGLSCLIFRRATARRNRSVASA